MKQLSVSEAPIPHTKDTEALQLDPFVASVYALPGVPPGKEAIMEWREALLKKKSEAGTERAGDLIHLDTWNMTLLKESLHRGKAVSIWSQVLGEKLICILHEKERERVSLKYPEEQIYTLDEVTTLAKSKIPPDKMKIMHLAKKLMGGNFTEGFSITKGIDR